MAHDRPNLEEMLLAFVTRSDGMLREHLSELEKHRLYLNAHGGNLAELELPPPPVSRSKTPATRTKRRR